MQMIADMSEGSTPGDSDGDARASIRATTYTLQSPKASAIQAFLKEAIAHYRAKLDCAKAKQYLYVLADASVNPPIFRRSRLDRNKTFKGMFFPEKDKVLAGFDNFRHRRGNHGKNESPWKLTYLLYGPPGTGVCMRVARGACVWMCLAVSSAYRTSR